MQSRALEMNEPKAPSVSVLGKKSLRLSCERGPRTGNTTYFNRAREDEQIQPHAWRRCLIKNAAFYNFSWDTLLYRAKQIRPMPSRISLSPCMHARHMPPYTLPGYKSIEQRTHTGGVVALFSLNRHNNTAVQQYSAVDQKTVDTSKS